MKTLKMNEKMYSTFVEPDYKYEYMPDHEFQLKMSAREIYKTIMVHFKMTLVRITHIGTLGSHL